MHRFQVPDPLRKARQAVGPVRPVCWAFVLMLIMGGLSSKRLGAADPPIASQYNAGVASYRDGKFELAAELFRKAAAADDRALAAKARYNLANTFYARAVALLKSDEPSQRVEVINQLEAAIAHYDSALRLEPSDEDAAYNRELAEQLIERLRNPSQSREQSPSNEAQSQQNQNQQNDAQQDRQQQDRQQQDRQQQDRQQQNRQQQNRQQQNQPQQTKPPSDSHSNDSSDHKSDSEPAQGSGEQADAQTEQPPPREGDQQSPSENQIGPNDQNPENQGDQDSDRVLKSVDRDQTGNHQDSPQPRLSSSGQHEQQNDDQNRTDSRNENQNKSSSDSEIAPADQSAEKPPSGQLKSAAIGDEPSEQTGDLSRSAATDIRESLSDRISGQEAEKLLQSIRDREMLRRLHRAAERRARRIPVPRDW